VKVITQIKIPKHEGSLAQQLRLVKRIRKEVKRWSETDDNVEQLKELLDHHFKKTFSVSVYGAYSPDGITYLWAPPEIAGPQIERGREGWAQIVVIEVSK
jgi:hypothetical protein